MNWYSLNTDDKWIVACLGVFLIVSIACLIHDHYNIPRSNGDEG